MTVLPQRRGDQWITILADDPFAKLARGLDRILGHSAQVRHESTYGGYSERITVDERFVLKIGAGLSPAGAAPLLCAGIATYSPLRHWGVKAGSRVGVIGLGGLGHIAVKLAAAMGADVTVLSTSAGKANDAAKLGARDFAITKDENTFTRLAGSFDLILNTVSAGINYDAFLTLLKRDGVLVILGVPDGAVSFNAFGLMMKRKSIASSPIGGLPETQEMLDFCAQHGIVSDVEIIPVNAVNAAYERILKSDVRYLCHRYGVATFIARITAVLRHLLSHAFLWFLSCPSVDKQASNLLGAPC